MMPDRDDLTPISRDFDPVERGNAEQEAARAEALRVAQEVAGLNGITVSQALAAMEGAIQAEQRFGNGPTPEEKQAELLASSSRAERRHQEHLRKVERRAAARRVQR